MMLIRRLLIFLTLGTLLCGTANAGQRSFQLRFGYLDDPGSAPVLLAAEHGYFKRERLSVTLVKFDSVDKGVAALAAGKIEAGAFPAGDVLRTIAGSGDLQIVAGGGTPMPGELLAELDRSAQSELRAREMVTVINSGKTAGTKETATRLVKALIRAHQQLQQHETKSLQSIKHHLSHQPLPGAYRFDPNPDYYRFAATWEDLGLQKPGMRRDHLNSHVYEEIYCDALDRALDEDPQNEVLQKLSSVAVCIPDCCPDAKKRKNKTSKGATP